MQAVIAVTNSTLQCEILKVIRKGCCFYQVKIFRNNFPTILLLSGIIISGLMNAGISFVGFMIDTDKHLEKLSISYSVRFLRRQCVLYEYYIL